jgi:hypothetical protein
MFNQYLIESSFNQGWTKFNLTKVEPNSNFAEIESKFNLIKLQPNIILVKVVPN